jgi:hypothetical protein
MVIYIPQAEHTGLGTVPLLSDIPIQNLCFFLSFFGWDLVMFLRLSSNSWAQAILLPRPLE